MTEPKGDNVPESQVQAPSSGHVDVPSDSTLVGWFASNPVAANIVMLFLVVAGLLAARGMITETFPSIDPKTITIVTPYPGATPYDIEESITRRVEEGMIGIEGVKRVSSSATEGVGRVTVEMEHFADPAQVLDDVETAVDSLSDFPPQEAEETSIVKTKLTSSMMSLAVFGSVDEKTLHYWAERIEGDLLSLPEVSLVEVAGPEVSLVEVAGGRRYEIAIEVSEATLRDYGLTLDDVARRVAEFSIDIPGGNLRTDAGDILIRVKDKRYTGVEFANITIRSRSDGAQLRLGDIATIRDGFEDTRLINRYNGKAALFVRVSRSDSQDTLKMEEAIKGYLTGLSLPQGLSIEIWRNNTDILRDRISLMLRNAILGYLLVFMCLLLFLDLKLAFWTSLGIPISFLGGLFIFHEQQMHPGDPTAVLRGVHLVKAPVTIGVLTTIAAFAPLLMSTGTLAQVMRPVPLVVIAILSISLIEAFYILPAHLANTSTWSRGLLAKVRDRTQAGLDSFVQRRIIPAIKLGLAYRYATLALACQS